MGGTYYDTNTYTAKLNRSAATGKSLFTHDDDIKKGRADKKVHKNLDPSKLNSAGKNVRESFDSTTHPVTNAVSVLFDVTGSMNTVPQVFIKKLDKLMSGLVSKGYLEGPQVLFGAIGDANSDYVPLQIGQFESGNEMDDVLGNIFLEGGGGGQQHESYELAMYYMARHTEMDCLNKRGKKGYLFLIGDELPYGMVSSNQVKAIIGDSLEEDIPLKTILSELRKKFHVFWIMPKGTSYWDNDNICNQLKELFGENFLRLENPEEVCELVIWTIGLLEGFSLASLSKDLKDLGVKSSTINNITKSLSTKIDKNTSVVGVVPTPTKMSNLKRF